MTGIKRGAVVLLRFPNTDLRTYKRRPALVVQADMPTGLNQKIVALITSNLTRTGPTRVAVNQASQAGQEMGLRGDSVIVLDNLATVLEREIDRVIGYCPAMDTVELALCRVFGLASGRKN